MCLVASRSASTEAAAVCCCVCCSFALAIATCCAVLCAAGCLQRCRTPRSGNGRLPGSTGAPQLLQCSSHTRCVVLCCAVRIASQRRLRRIKEKEDEEKMAEERRAQEILAERRKHRAGYRDYIRNNSPAAPRSEAGSVRSVSTARSGSQRSRQRPLALKRHGGAHTRLLYSSRPPAQHGAANCCRLPHRFWRRTRWQQLAAVVTGSGWRGLHWQGKCCGYSAHRTSYRWARWLRWLQQF